jgi:DNA-binding cell septation regulator SpoVG
MKITIERIEPRPAQVPSFNVALSSSEGKDAFLTIKGCRVVDGSKGRFISWPAKKLESGKYWNHVLASEGFMAAVLAEHDKTARKQQPKSLQDMDNDPPF